MGMRNEINNELVILLKSGDENAFCILFRSFYNPLVHFAQAYIHDIEISKNIVQTVFMKLWEKKKSLKENENLKPFLYTLTRNESISYLRHEKAGKRFLSKNFQNADDLELSIGALEQLDFSKIDLDNIQKIVEQTLENMPDRCREVFVMSRYKQVKNHEIAGELGISVKAVESNITRALKILRENLKDYLPVGLLQIIILH